MFELRDFVSSSSHLATAVWAVFATILLLRLTPPGGGRRVSVFIYGISMIMLFLASGTFHGLHYNSSEEMRFYQKIDQSAVYILIVGTSTPVLTILLQGNFRKIFLTIMWTLAFMGVASLWLLPKPPHALVVSLYLAIGYVSCIPVYKYYRVVGWRAMNWVWLGAFFYTIGAVCELTKWPVIIPGWIQSHEVLHLCDSAGCLAFFVFIIRYVIPYGWVSESIGSRDDKILTTSSALPSSLSGERRLPLPLRSGIVQH